MNLFMESRSKRISGVLTNNSLFRSGGGGRQARSTPPFAPHVQTSVLALAGSMGLIGHVGQPFLLPTRRVVRMHTWTHTDMQTRAHIQCTCLLFVNDTCTQTYAYMRACTHTHNNKKYLFIHKAIKKNARVGMRTHTHTIILTDTHISTGKMFTAVHQRMTQTSITRRTCY